MGTLENELKGAFKIFQKAKVKLEKVARNCELTKDAAMSRMEQARDDIEISGNVRSQAVNSIKKIDEIMGVSEGIGV